MADDSFEISTPQLFLKSNSPLGAGPGVHGCAGFLFEAELVPGKLHDVKRIAPKIKP